MHLTGIASAERRALEHVAEFAQRAHLGRSHAENERAALGLDVDKALRLEAQEGLAYRRLADAELAASVVSESASPS